MKLSYFLNPINPALISHPKSFKLKELDLSRHQNFNLNSPDEKLLLTKIFQIPKNNENNNNKDLLDNNFEDIEYTNAFPQLTSISFPIIRPESVVWLLDNYQLTLKSVSIGHNYYPLV
jgi:hypothetical protein